VAAAKLLLANAPVLAVAANAGTAPAATANAADTIVSIAIVLFICYLATNLLYYI
jgi:hypothetical protein